HPPPPFFPYTTLFRSSQPTCHYINPTGFELRLSLRRVSLHPAFGSKPPQAICHYINPTGFGLRLSLLSLCRFSLRSAFGSKPSRSEEHTSELQSRFDL